MEKVSEKLVEIGSSFEQAYKPVLDFHGWRVAMLRHFEVVSPKLFHRVERHNDTNEVFILTTGFADLIVCKGDGGPEEPAVIPMVHNVAYNVRQAVWHHVLMSTDAHIILFERSETGPENSDYAELPSPLIDSLKARLSEGVRS